MMIDKKQIEKDAYDAGINQAIRDEIKILDTKINDYDNAGEVEDLASAYESIKNLRLIVGEKLGEIKRAIQKQERLQKKLERQRLKEQQNDS